MQASAVNVGSKRAQFALEVGNRFDVGHRRLIPPLSAKQRRRSIDIAR